MKNAIEMFGAPIMSGQSPRSNGPTVGQVITTVAVIGVATLIVVATIKAAERHILAEIEKRESQRKA